MFLNEQAQCPALITSRSGLHIPHDKQRYQVIVNYGLLERDSEHPLSAESHWFLLATVSRVGIGTVSALHAYLCNLFRHIVSDRAGTQ
jgi:hypothetical protein